MEIENKTAGYWGGEVSSPHKPKPFVTILDGGALSASPKYRKLSSKPRRQPLGSARKQGRKLQAYAGETAKSAAKGLAKTLAGIVASVVSAPKTMVDAIKNRKIGKAEKKNPNFEPDLGVQSLEAALSAENSAQPDMPSAAAPARPRLSFPFRLPSSAALLRLGALRDSTQARRILPVILICSIVLTAGAAAVFNAAQFPVRASSLILPDEESAQALLMAYVAPEGSDKENLPAGSLPPIPLAVKLGSYTVRSGDTLEKIAKRFGLRQDTIISVNNLQSASSLRAGISLRIPNMDGVSHKVRRGENLSSLSKTYAIDMTRIVDANDLASSTIAVGQSLFIPNARLSSASLKQFYGMQFQWPARGRISSPFGFRSNPFTGLRTYHSAVDIVVNLGTSIKATNDGRVADTGYNSVFGNYIILKHDSGYQSLYAHLSKINVKEGSYISKGSVIGLSGNTGQSTGPHLHFSLFKNGQALDPLKYLN